MASASERPQWARERYCRRGRDSTAVAHALSMTPERVTPALEQPLTLSLRRKGLAATPRARTMLSGPLNSQLFSAREMGRSVRCCRAVAMNSAPELPRALPLSSMVRSCQPPYCTSSSSSPLVTPTLLKISAGAISLSHSSSTLSALFATLPFSVLSLFFSLFSRSPSLSLALSRSFSLSFLSLSLPLSFLTTLSDSSTSLSLSLSGSVNSPSSSPSPPTTILSRAAAMRSVTSCSFPAASRTIASIVLTPRASSLPLAVSATSSMPSHASLISCRALVQRQRMASTGAGVEACSWLPSLSSD
mmetsp:Transcript_4279/g.15072  ORF Transcript_4279/g.15072 Transcript_4279/m.15072 type:complete len:303 (-) Transcript_4279:60-968(-)